MSGHRAPYCPRCRGGLDEESFNGICKWCLPPRKPDDATASAVLQPEPATEPWQFDQRPGLLDLANSGARPAFAMGHRVGEEWGISIMVEGRIVAHFTPAAAREFAHELWRMAEVSEGRHASQVQGL